MSGNYSNSIDNSRICLLLFTRNNSDDLDKLLNYSHKYFDEIIVVDSYSEDNVEKVVDKYNAKIYYAPILGYQDPLFNKGIELCKSSWVAILDLDEYLSYTLLKDLKKIISYGIADNIKGFSIPFLEIAKGRFFSMEFSKIKIFKKGYVYFSGNVHCKPTIDGKVLDLNFPYVVIHDFVRGGWSKLFKKHVKYLYLIKFSSIFSIGKIPLLPKILPLEKNLGVEVPRPIILLISIYNPYLAFIKYIRGYRRKYSLLSVLYHIILSTLYYYPYIFRGSGSIRIARMVNKVGISKLLNLHITNKRRLME